MLTIFCQKKLQYIDFPFIKLNYERLKKYFFYNFLSYPTPLKNREFPKTPITFLIIFIRKNEVQIRNQHPQIHQNSYIKPQVHDPPQFGCVYSHVNIDRGDNRKMTKKRNYQNFSKRVSYISNWYYK